MNTATLPPFLLPAGKALLLGAFGWALVRGMYRGEGPSLAFERLAIGFMAIAFFPEILNGLLGLASALAEMISGQVKHEGLKELVLRIVEKVDAPLPDGSAPARGTINLPALVGQVWRTGVWGVLSAIVDCIFLVAQFLIEAGREVFWQLILVLFPVVAGLFPVFPRLMLNLLAYGVEVALWLPVLRLIDLATSHVVRRHMEGASASGLPIIAIEILAVILVFSIPSITHRIVSGALHGDLDGSTGSILRMARKAVTTARLGLRVLRGGVA